MSTEEYKRLMKVPKQPKVGSTRRRPPLYCSMKPKSKETKQPELEEGCECHKSPGTQDMKEALQSVFTKYKMVDKKVRPVKASLPEELRII